jgi:multiple sugar transport system permease protein
VRGRSGIGLGKTTPYALLLPAFAVVFGLAAYTVVFLVRMSLVKWDFGLPWETAQWVGLQNYLWLLTNPGSPLWNSLKVTGIYTLGILLVELVLGLVLAALLNRRIFGRSVYTALLLIPMVIMPSMVGLVWRLYFSYDGLVNFFLELVLGVKLNWLGRQWALAAVMIVDVWEWTPFFILIFLAGFQALPVEPFDAAKVDGASRWQVLRFVTLPLLGPLIMTSSILRLMDILRIFDVIYVITGGGPGSATVILPILIWRETMIARNIGKGSAVAVLLIVLIACLTIVMNRVFQKSRYQE